MRSYWRGSALALMAATFFLVLCAPAQAGCASVSGTADGFDKETAVSRAQLALDDYVKQYKAAKHLSAVNVSAMRVSPNPYWRDSVSDDQFCFGTHCGFYKPDIVTAHSHTICWHGVALCVYVPGSACNILHRWPLPRPMNRTLSDLCDMAP